MDARRLSPGENLFPLVDSYIEELYKNGGDVPHTREAVCAMLAAIEGGVCMVAGSPVVAWSAATEFAQPWPTRYGRTAMGLGTYVRPDHRRSGIATTLRVGLQEELRRMGFDTLIGGVHSANAEGLASLTEETGFTPYQILGYRRLN